MFVQILERGLKKLHDRCFLVVSRKEKRLILQVLQFDIVKDDFNSIINWEELSLNAYMLVFKFG